MRSRKNPSAQKEEVGLWDERLRETMTKVIERLLGPEGSPTLRLACDIHAAA